ncbi:MAG: Zn-dependent hydrolase [Bacillota bacterium]
MKRITVNISRLKENLIELGWIGYKGNNKEMPYGDKGITRLAYSEEYKKADKLVASLMEEAGLEVYHDSVGNLFGTLTASETDEHIMIGSHIDTVPEGGMFDGSLGVLGALECVQTLIENNYSNNHNLTVVAFIGEEGTEIGGTLGSRCFTGDIELNKKEIEFFKDKGIDSEDLKKSRIHKNNVKNYLEMHIEQGKVLQTEDVSIGVVQGIVGIARYKVTVIGKANHAGTTPMKLRDDALVKASKLITKINKIVNDLAGGLVGTVGTIEVEPGAVNVIPGRVEFTVELRDMEKDKMNIVMENIKEGLDEHELMIEDILYEEGVYLNKKVQKAIKSSAKKMNYDYKEMISGAGHDANPLSKVTSTGMIFVPSHRGISHSPEEWTDWKEIQKGMEVMFKTIKKLDKSN